MQFLKANCISEHEQPFYQYYNEDGELQLNFYYDVVQSAGIGIFYEQYQGQITSFCSYGVVTGYKEPIREWVVKIVSTYREDATIQKQKRSYNARQLGRESGTYYYDQQERLEYVDAYITHGYLERYYIYDRDSKKTQYCLVLDHAGSDVCATLFIRYEQ